MLFSNESRGDRTRTCDSLVPNQERYQLRYTPNGFRECCFQMKVGVTGLEPATAWSQTRNATNCATPRKLWLETSVLFKCGAKVRIIFELSKFFQNFLPLFVKFSCFLHKRVHFTPIFLLFEQFLDFFNSTLRILGVRIEVEGFLVVGNSSLVHLFTLTFLPHEGIFHGKLE